MIRPCNAIREHGRDIPCNKIVRTAYFLRGSTCHYRSVDGAHAGVKPTKRRIRVSTFQLQCQLERQVNLNQVSHLARNTMLERSDVRA